MNSPRVLIVDDDEGLVEALAVLMRAKGWQVATALDGDTAAKLFRAGRFDVVLMDVRMPRVDGLLAMREMKEVAPKTPFVLMSGQSLGPSASAVAQEGSFLLAKPLDPERLERVLADAVAAR